MTRNKNDYIGKSGEIRIKAVLEELGAQDVILNKPKKHPDCTFMYLAKAYAAEFKTMIPFYEKVVGHVHLRSTEVHAMQDSIAQGHVPCMIVEVRPKGRTDKIYYFIEWGLVIQEYNKTAPEIKSLSFYWIIENGHGLKHALSLIGQGYPGMQTAEVRELKRINEDLREKLLERDEKIVGYKEKLKWIDVIK